MQLLDGHLVYSASDLVGFLACEHLTNLERAAAARLVERPFRKDPELELMMQRGVEHERTYLEELRSAGKRVTAIDPDEPGDRSPDWLRDAAERTRAALHRGDEVIYQAALFEGHWRGHADFLLRVDTPSNLGPFPARRRPAPCSSSASTATSWRPSRAARPRSCTSRSAGANGGGKRTGSATTTPTTGW